MKLSHRLPLVLGLLALAPAPAALAQAPFVETRPLSLHWSFTLTGVSGTTIGSTPLPVDSAGNVVGLDDPDRLNPTDRITTEQGRLIAYTPGTGDQAFIIKHLLRSVIENGEQAIREEDLTGRWELTAVREPQTTVLGAATTPYQIFLTRIEGTKSGGRISASYATANLDVTTVKIADPFDLDEEGEPEFNPEVVPTGLWITFDRFVGAYNETLSGGRVTRATGNITVAYTIDFGSVFADDPRFLAKPTTDTDDQGNEIEVPPALGQDFHSKVNHWNAAGTGILTAAIRTTPGPLVAVVPTKINMTAHGSWSHVSIDYSGVPDDPIKFQGFGGIAPLRLKLGEAKFQRRELFFRASAP